MRCSSGEGLSPTQREAGLYVFLERIGLSHNHPHVESWKRSSVQWRLLTGSPYEPSKQQALESLSLSPSEKKILTFEDRDYGSPEASRGPLAVGFLSLGIFLGIWLSAVLHHFL